MNRIVDAAMILKGVEDTITIGLQLELQTEHSMRAALAIADEEMNSPEQCLLITALMRDILTTMDNRMERVLNITDDRNNGKITD